MKETQANNGADSPQLQPHTVDNENINPNGLSVGRIQFSQKDYSDMSKAVDTALQYSDHDEMSMTDCEGKKVSIQYHWDTDIYDTMDVVRRLLIANGFLPETVQNGFEYMVNEFYATDEDIEDSDQLEDFMTWVKHNLNKIDINLRPSQEIVAMYENRNTPKGICKDCGETDGKKVDEGCTWWGGICGGCLEFCEVCDERDYQ